MRLTPLERRLAWAALDRIERETNEELALLVRMLPRKGTQHGA